MKTIPADLVNCGTLIFGVRIQRKDSTVLAYTQHDRDQTVTIDAVSTPLLANPSFNIQSLTLTAGLDVNTTDIYVTASGDMTRADILAGVWDGAEVLLFRYNWKLPASGVDQVVIGSFGNFTPMLGQFKVEFRDLRQPLQQQTTWVFQEQCRNRLGDARCTIDLAPLTFSATITAVANQYQFTAPALVQASDYFGEGFLVWTAGANVGTPRHKVKAFAAGVVTLSEACIKPIAISDTFDITAGCRKRWDVDCRDKFDNLLNNNSEKDKPTRNDLIATAPVTP